MPKKKHNAIFQTETEKIYENIYEIDITHNRPASEATKQYFSSLGIPKNTPYDQALQFIAQKQVKEEFQAGYLFTFSPEHILQVYQDGKDTLSYDFMFTNDNGEHYYWIRITVRIFYWDEDKSVSMFVYRQNIDSSKRQEQEMVEKWRKTP